MFLYKNKILITGGSGRFGKILKEESIKYKFNFLFPKKKIFNILSIKNIENYVKKEKPKYLIHLAGFSRPMKAHEEKIWESIDKNIIGTANVTKICIKYNIKLIYVSTCYVYPGTKGNYIESDPLLPSNNYAWSKLGGECSVHMYKNSLILRASITEEPFVHKAAFIDFKTNFIFHKDLIKGILNSINLKGVLNVGGKAQTVYKFAKKYNPNIKKLFAKKILGKNANLNFSMNVKKFQNIND